VKNAGGSKTTDDLFNKGEIKFFSDAGRRKIFFFPEKIFTTFLTGLRLNSYPCVMTSVSFWQKPRPGSLSVTMAWN